MASTSAPSAHPVSSYKWLVVGLLWFCGFFNYADRQAVFSVFPLLKNEFHLSNAELGLVGSSFMAVYAVMAPFSGFLVDLAPRRWLIGLGLWFWSIICAATALSRRFAHLLFFRAAEGLGESFYFPASMSVLADYHSPRTRSRAMGIHQTSVYAGTVGGAVLAGYMCERWGWRSPFWLLGMAGMIYGLLLWKLLIEPRRGQAADDKAPVGDDAYFVPAASRADFWRNVSQVVRSPSAAVLLAVFAGANFVAAVMLTWLPQFVYSKFSTSLTNAAITSTYLHMASLAGSLCGGPLADWAAARPGGRMRVQATALLGGAPLVYLAGSTHDFPLFIVALIGTGFCKGLYDANIFASIYDVVPTSVRGTAAGLMNTIGWSGGLIAPYAIGLASDSSGLSAAIASTAAVYVAAGLLALVAAALASRSPMPTSQKQHRDG